MVVLRVFVPPMCCSTGVCGPTVNPVLARFAADLNWLKSQEVRVERFNLVQQPDAFTKDSIVEQMLARVALARMLANDPTVILADEPTGNLDPETSQQIIGFLEEFNEEGRTIVMVTHDPRAARRAKRLLKLTRGTIVSAENIVDVSGESEDEEDKEARDAA